MPLLLFIFPFPYFAINCIRWLVGGHWICWLWSPFVLGNKWDPFPHNVGPCKHLKMESLLGFTEDANVQPLSPAVLLGSSPSCLVPQSLIVFVVGPVEESRAGGVVGYQSWATEGDNEHPEQLWALIVLIVYIWCELKIGNNITTRWGLWSHDGKALPLMSEEHYVCARERLFVTCMSLARQCFDRVWVKITNIEENTFPFSSHLMSHLLVLKNVVSPSLPTAQPV